jgi:polyisoprenyl-phosphate glycosyltransferase
MPRPALRDTLISVVLPVYNEARVLEELCRRVADAVALCGTQREIVFVNDGSSDNSAEILDSLAERHPFVRVVHLSRNFGHQAAVQAGLSHARGDAVVLMDSDLQDSPEAIGRLVAEWVCGYDVIYALRRERPEAWWKRCLFAAFHRLLSRVASTPIPTDAGNFSLIDARVVQQIVALGEQDRYLPGLRSWVGFKQRGVEVRRNPRYDGQPRVSIRGLWRLAKTAIFSFSSFPLTAFYTIGYGAMAVFAALGGYLLFCKAFTGLAAPDWASQVLVASFFGAVNALGISILGEYVIRIYDQVRGRPLYMVDRTCNLGRAETSPEAPAVVEFHPTEAAPAIFAVSRSDADELITAELAADESEFADLLAEAEELMAMAGPAVRSPAKSIKPLAESLEGPATERRKASPRRRATASGTPKVAARRGKRADGERKQRRGE